MKKDQKTIYGIKYLTYSYKFFFRKSYDKFYPTIFFIRTEFHEFLGRINIEINIPAKNLNQQTKYAFFQKFLVFIFEIINNHPHTLSTDQTKTIVLVLLLAIIGIDVKRFKINFNNVQLNNK